MKTEARGRKPLFQNSTHQNIQIDSEIWNALPKPKQKYIREAINEKFGGRSNNELLVHAETAMLERMNDPKNVIKGSWDGTLREIKEGVIEEYLEVLVEYDREIIKPVLLRSELADLMVQCSRAILKLDKELLR
jgi:TRAP-type C4-dicarboxylate transport system substrate-binding protein